MNKSLKTFFKSDVDEWKAIFAEFGITYRITNLSDYSGTEFLIEWAE